MTNIINNTPWNTEDLEKLLLPMFTGCGIMQATIDLMAPRTARYSNKQHFSTAFFKGSGPDGTGREHVVVELLSPKRAAAKAETLDRLSLAGDLKAHETRLPASVITQLTHGFTVLREAYKNQTQHRDQYEVRRLFQGAVNCLHGWCHCEVAPVIDPPTIRGDTKARTHASPNQATVDDLLVKRRDLEKLQQSARNKAEGLRREAEAYDRAAEAYDPKIQKIDERIIKVKAKEAMSVPLGTHQDGEEDDNGNEGQQEAE